MKPFQATQLAFTAYLRSGDADKPRDRRQAIYRDGFYKNIYRAVSDIFPVAKRIAGEPRWGMMAREFIRETQLQTPYFHELGEEFLHYLMHLRTPLATDHPFLIEVAHFDWIQFALYIADAELPPQRAASTPTEGSLWEASPLALGLTYSYPIHSIDESNLQPQAGSTPTHLLAYRNRSDEVEVLATDALSLRIVQLLQAHERITCQQQSQLLADEFGTISPDMLQGRVQEILVFLAEKEIVFFNEPHGSQPQRPADDSQGGARCQVQI